MIIGITGTLGAGKGEAAMYLERKGFMHLSVRAFLVRELQRRELPVNRDTMTPLANELRASHGPSYIIEQLYAQAKQAGGNAIIESVRTPGEVEFLRQQKDFYLLAVDADPKLRYERIVARKSVTDDITFEKFQADEKREFENTDPTKQNLSKCMQMADVVLQNNGTLDELYAQIEQFLATVAK